MVILLRGLLYPTFDPIRLNNYRAGLNCCQIGLGGDIKGRVNKDLGSAEFGLSTLTITKHERE